MRTCVVILSSYLLFAEGIVSRLRQYLCSADLEIVDPRQPDAIEQIVAAQPSVVILDSRDSGVTRFCPLSQLLRSLPELRACFRSLGSCNTLRGWTEKHTRVT